MIDFWSAVTALIVLFLLVPGLLAAPWFPTKLDTVRQMMLMAEVTPDDIVYDLGSDDGRVVRARVGELDEAHV